LWRQLDNLLILSNGEFRLNPDAYCPLTLSNTSIKTVRTIQDYFMSYSADEIIKRLRTLFAAEPIKVKEIDIKNSTVDEPEIRRALSFSSPLDRAELFFWIYASYFYTRQTIERAAEAFAHHAIEGLKYDKLNCRMPECQARHDKIFTIEEARKIKFRPGCRCDLLPYKSSWDTPTTRRENKRGKS
jgi:hypothetical protein